MISVSTDGTIIYNKLTEDRSGKINRALFDLASFLESQAKRNLNSNKSRQTGKLGQSIMIEKKGQGYQVRVAQNYGKYVEYGRKAVKPKEKKLLFIPLSLKAKKQGWNSGMELGKDYVLAKKAKASKPKPFFMPAVKLTKKRVKPTFKNIFIK